MFGIGLPELIVILALALIVLGPEKLPQVAKQAARLINELRKVSDEFKKELEIDKIDDIRKPIKLDKVLGEDFTKLVKQKDLMGPDFLKSDSDGTGPGGLGPEWKEAGGSGNGIGSDPKGTQLSKNSNSLEPGQAGEAQHELQSREDKAPGQDSPSSIKKDQPAMPDSDNSEPRS